jgi:hypothetical protein
MKSVFPILSVLVLLLGLSSAVAHARDDGSPGRTRRDLRELAAKISGRASLLVDVASRRPTQVFHDRARHFEDAVERRDHLGDDWREICNSLRKGSSKRLVMMVNPRFCTTASSS